MTDIHSAPDDQVEAAEYVLGLLTPDEAKQFEAQLSESPEMREDVADWREFFANMAGAVPEIAPPVAIYAAISDRLFSGKRRRRIALPRIFEVAIGAVAAAFFAFGVIFFTQSNLSQPNSVIATEIAAADGSVVVNAVYIVKSGELRIARESDAPAEGRAFQLWLVAGDSAPESLGLLPEQATSSLIVPGSLRWRVQGATLAISDEPAGGSPTGAPTGAILAVGVVAGV